MEFKLFQFIFPNRKFWPEKSKSIIKNRNKDVCIFGKYSFVSKYSIFGIQRKR